MLDAAIEQFDNVWIGKFYGSKVTEGRALQGVWP